jgi:hypothetical protein
MDEIWALFIAMTIAASYIAGEWVLFLMAAALLMMITEE